MVWPFLALFLPLFKEPLLVICAIYASVIPRSKHSLLEISTPPLSLRKTELAIMEWFMGAWVFINDPILLGPSKQLFYLVLFSFYSFWNDLIIHVSPLTFLQIVQGVRFYGYMFWKGFGSYAVLTNFQRADINSIFLTFKTKQLFGMIMYKQGSVSGLIW